MEENNIIDIELKCNMNILIKEVMHLQEQLLNDHTKIIHDPKNEKRKRF
jgi:hypothetical protein